VSALQAESGEGEGSELPFAANARRFVGCIYRCSSSCKCRIRITQ
jgi:hypothetical protein